MDPNLLKCKCYECIAANHSREFCLKNKCECCDLEDAFALLSHIEPAEVLVTRSPTSPSLVVKRHHTHFHVVNSHPEVITA